MLLALPFDSTLQVPTNPSESSEEAALAAYRHGVQGQPGRGRSPEARTRTSGHAFLTANRPLVPHPFRSGKTRAPRKASGGSCAAPYHGELAVGVRVSAVADSVCLIWSLSGLEVPQPPGGGSLKLKSGPLAGAAVSQNVLLRVLVPFGPSPVPQALPNQAPLQAELSAPGEFLTSLCLDFFKVIKVFASVNN